MALDPVFLISERQRVPERWGVGTKQFQSSLPAQSRGKGLAATKFSIPKENSLREALIEWEGPSEEEGFLLLLAKRAGLCVRDGAATFLGREAGASELCCLEGLEETRKVTGKDTFVQFSS